MRTRRRREQAGYDALDQIGSHLLPGTLAMVFGAVLLVTLSWAERPLGRLLQVLWVTSVALPLTATFSVWFRYRREPRRHPPSTWINRFLGPSIAVSTVWGLYGFLTPLTTAPDRTELLQFSFLCACAAGSVPAFAASRRLAMSYLIPMWVIAIGLLIAHGSYALASGSAVFLALMCGYVRDAALALSEAMSLRHSEAALGEQLRRSEAQARAVIDTAVEAIWSTDLRGTVRDVNPAGSALIGYEEHQVEGRNIGEFLPNTARWMASETTPTASFEDTLVTGRGQVRSMMVSISIVDPTGDGYATVMARDISERKALEERLAHEANHDGLTALPNRIGFFRSAETAIDACRTIDEEVAVIFVDLDRFKQVNDSLGHAAGDELLLQTSRRLLDEVRDGDLVARLGGDEFVMLLPRPPDAAQLQEFGLRLIAALERPFVLDDDEARISASVGIASTAARSTTAHDLVAKADIAMYKAKQAGRRQVVTYDDELQRTVDEHIRLEQSFRRALECCELEPWLQPIVELSDGSVVGAELLTRWRRPGVGIVTPDVFIPLAQEAGLIADLGRWVLDCAADLLAGWTEDPCLRHVCLSVNISGRHLLNGSVADEIDRKFIQQGIDPARLLVELTETDLAEDVDQAHDALQAVRRLGAEVAIDDFGTGYSSLAYLQELPASTIKIDRRFVSAIDEDPRQATLVRAVLEMASAFDLRVVAEGIETASQADALRRLGARFGQGYLFGRPMPTADFERTMLAAVLSSGT